MEIIKLLFIAISLILTYWIYNGIKEGLWFISLSSIYLWIIIIPGTILLLIYK